MNNVIQFPSPKWVEVSAFTDGKSGLRTYVFLSVEGELRQEISEHSTFKEVAAKAADFIARGYDVVWDQAARKLLFGNEEETE